MSDVLEYDDGMKDRMVGIRTSKNHYREGIVRAIDPESKSIILSVDNGTRTVLLIGNAIQNIQIIHDNQQSARPDGEQNQDGGKQKEEE